MLKEAKNDKKILFLMAFLAIFFGQTGAHRQIEDSLLKYEFCIGISIYCKSIMFTVE